MLFISIPKENDLEKLPQAAEFGVELRLDLWPSWTFPSLQKLIQTLPFPVLLTHKTAKEETLLKLLELSPAFMDLSLSLSPAFLSHAIASFPKTKIIVSYHDFTGVPNLSDLFCTMQKFPAHFYKIAVTPTSSSEALTALLFKQKHPNVSLICMGKDFSFARIIGKVLGNPLHYCALEETTAPGQLSFTDLENIYHFSCLNAKTSLYGLIGDPVEQSLGHLYHNQIFREKNQNCVYVKMKVEEQELEEFLSLAKKIPFQGLSVTMPLKEKILPFIESDGLVQNIKSANTLRKENQTFFSTNTDGKGAVQAVLEKTLLKNKTVLILGAGGAARSIAYEAKKEGAIVWIYNRTEERAQTLASEMQCHTGIPPSYDVLINCAPQSAAWEFPNISPKTYVMDIVYIPKETLFLQKAKAKGCPIIYGEEMFKNQALKQREFWVL